MATPVFGQLVCGAPGSGKSTYCEAFRQYVAAAAAAHRQSPGENAEASERLYEGAGGYTDVAIVNLDMANDGYYPYPVDVNVCDLVSHQTVMEEEGLGPNGSYVFCTEYLAEHKQWLLDRVTALVERVDPCESRANGKREAGTMAQRGLMILFDCPGQVEVYNNSSAMKDLVNTLQKTLNISLCCVHLAEAAVVCRSVQTYASACLLSLSVMVHLELPHINLMSKYDRIEDREENAKYLYPSDFVEEWSDVVASQENTPRRMRALVTAILETVDGYNIVGYSPLAVEDLELMAAVVSTVNKTLAAFVA